VIVIRSNKGDDLSIESIANHDFSKLSKHTPILIIDAWEHAYYLDYKNQKKPFFENFTFVIDWETAEKRFTS